MKKVLLIIGVVLAFVGIALGYTLPHVGDFGLIRVCGFAIALIGMALCAVSGALFVQLYSKSYVLLYAVAALLVLVSGIKGKDVVADLIEGPKTIYLNNHKVTYYVELPSMTPQFYLDFEAGGKQFSMPIGTDIGITNVNGTYDFKVIFYENIEAVLRCEILRDDTVLSTEEYNDLIAGK